SNLLLSISSPSPYIGNVPSGFLTMFKKLSALFILSSNLSIKVTLILSNKYFWILTINSKLKTEYVNEFSLHIIFFVKVLLILFFNLSNEKLNRVLFSDNIVKSSNERSSIVP